MVPPLTAAGEKRTVLAAAVVGGFLGPFLGASVNVALPLIGAELGMDAVALAWVATSYLLAAAVFLVPFGRAADLLGRKRVYLAGNATLALGSILCACAPSAGWLFAFRVVQGLGGAMTFGTSTAIVSSVFPPGERGRALGALVAAVYLGGSVAPFVGGFLAEHLGWRSIFVSVVPLGLLVIGLLWRVPHEWAEARGEPFDWAGSAVYGAAVLALMVGLGRLPSAAGAALLAAGVALLAGFAALELRLRHPVFEVSLFARNRVFAFSNLAALINYSATFATGFVLSLDLQYLRGLRPAHAGLLLVSQPAVQALFSPLAGRLSDRAEPRVLASAGMALTAAGLAALVPLLPGAPLWALVLVLMVQGLGFALFSAPNINAAMGAVEPRQLGIASAALSTMRLMGMTLSMGVVTVALGVQVGRAQITPLLHPALLRASQGAFALFAALCVAGIGASLARGRRAG